LSLILVEGTILYASVPKAKISSGTIPVHSSSTAHAGRNSQSRCLSAQFMSAILLGKPINIHPASVDHNFLPVFLHLPKKTKRCFSWGVHGQLIQDAELKSNALIHTVNFRESIVLCLRSPS